MSSIESAPKPLLLTDIDGTAINELGRDWLRDGFGLNPRKWLKGLPFTEVENFPEFISGIKEAGFESGGFVTSRPNLAEIITKLNLGLVGLGDIFPEGSSGDHTGNHRNKAKALVGLVSDRCQSLYLDNNPASLMPFLVDELTAISTDRHTPLSVVIGVVARNRRDSFAWTAHQVTRGRGLSCSYSHNLGDMSARTGLGKNFSVTAVDLPPYSHSAGLELGELVLDAHDEMLTKL